MSPGRRSLLSLAVIAVALAAAAVAFRLHPPPPPPPAAGLQPVLDFPPDEVRSLAIRGWQGTLRAARSPDGWKVEEVALGPGIVPDQAPLETPAPDEVDRILDGLVEDLVTTPQIDRFARGDVPLADFGLARPQATIEFGLAGGRRRGLEIGDLTVTTAALYARETPGDDVVQVGTLLFNDIAAALFRLRAFADPTAGEETT